MSSTTRHRLRRRCRCKDALDLAILIEEEARERYEEFADQMELHHTPEAAHFFRFMAGNEEKHRAELAARRARAVRRRAVVGHARDDLRRRGARLRRGARVHDGARGARRGAALGREGARLLRRGAPADCTTPTCARSSRSLRSEEIEHQELVRRELAKAPPDPESGGRRLRRRAGRPLTAEDRPCRR